MTRSACSWMQSFHKSMCPCEHRIEDQVFNMRAVQEAFPSLCLITGLKCQQWCKQGPSWAISEHNAMTFQLQMLCFQAWLCSKTQIGWFGSGCPTEETFPNTWMRKSWREVSGQLLGWARCRNCLDLQIIAQHTISSHIGPSQLLLAWSMRHLQGWLPEHADFWNSCVCLSPRLLSLALYKL